MIISKLLAEIEMLNKKDFVEFHSKYVKMLKKKKKQNQGHPVGSSLDFWLEDNDLYDDLIE